ncbi:MAG: hypothetical protein GYB68_20050 [Chloroflexi bacterium]|nr:hypothetical protein [Chloroflexota bacterium]
MSLVQACNACGILINSGLDQCVYCGWRPARPYSDSQAEARIREIQTALAGPPQDIESAFELARLHLRLGKNALGIMHLRTALNMAPGEPQIRILLVLASANANGPLPIGIQDEALPHLEWLETTHPRRYETRWLSTYHQLWGMYDQQQWERGETLGAQAIVDFPENALLHYVYGYVLLRPQAKADKRSLARFDAALLAMKLAADLNPRLSTPPQNIEAIQQQISVWEQG